MINKEQIIEDRLLRRMTIRDIAIKHNRSSTTITAVLREKGIRGPLHKRNPISVVPEDIFSSTNNPTIVERYNVSLAAVVRKRRELGVRQPITPKFSERLEVLCQKLFGVDYLPSQRFSEFLDYTIRNSPLNDRYKQELKEFYLEKRVTCGERSKRYYANQQLKKYIEENFTTTQLINGKVIRRIK